MDRDQALDNFGTALNDLLRSQLEKASPGLQLAMRETLLAPSGRVRIAIEMPSLSIVCTIQPSEDAEVKEVFRIEGGPGRAFRPGEN